MKSFYKIINWYFSKRALPYWCILLMDLFILFFSGILAYVMIHGGRALLANFAMVVSSLAMISVLSIVGMKAFSTYSGIIRYTSFDDLMKVFNANIITMFVCIVATFLMKALDVTAFAAFSPLAILTMMALATFLMWNLRVLVRALYDVSFKSGRVLRVLIYGISSDAVGLAKSLTFRRPRKFALRGFMTEGKEAGHYWVMGKKVYDATKDLADVIEKERIDGILVSTSSMNEFRQNQALQDMLIGAGCRIFMNQEAKEAKVKDGQITDDETGLQNDNTVDDIVKEVSVEDLLPRNEIDVDLWAVEQMLTGHRVLITGAAGSIGAEIARQVAQFKPSVLVLIDQAETPQHDIRLMMANEFADVESHTIVTSICNANRMESVFSTFRPEFVFHAAAYKHVPMMEDNPSEAVLNNIYGTKVLADLSVKFGVKKFVMVSTDKAVNPTNVMGCSKRICEIYVQSLDKKLKTLYKDRSVSEQAPTQFVTTRFGNVLGSNGSVIPLFRKQIQKGGPVTVTDERIVRFFMLIPEACNLVLEAGTKGKGGEIFVFDMGKPVRIADLARRMIRLSGAKDVQIKYTGLRPGEKLYEELLADEEDTKPSFHKKIRIAMVREYDYDSVNQSINELVNIAANFDDMATVGKMKEIVPEYKSKNSVYEQLDVEN